jgi:hypothetical protein
VGGVARWESVALVDGPRMKTIISGFATRLKEFEVSDPELTDDPVGTTVVIDNIDPDAASALLADDATQSLTTLLALYLERYPGVEITFRGNRLDPAALQERRADYELPLGESASRLGPVHLTVIEWNRRVPRELLLCDEHGLTLAVEKPDIHAPDFHFTAYAKWAGFREHEGELSVAGLHPELAPVLDAARDRLREHFRTRADEVRASVLEQWKDEQVYPYEQETQSELERVERDLFDVVAVNVARAVNSTGDRRAKRFSLSLLRQAIEQSPSSLRRVLREVLELPEEQLRDLDELLDRTSLTSLIALGKVVADRLDFLAGLQELVFEPSTRKAVLERSQLHRILAHEVWLFGDQYTLAVDDQGLDAVLRQHIHLLGREAVAEDLDPVRLEDGSSAIVDLLLAATIPLPTQQHEHLVIELKRPSLSLGHEELTQIQRYALAIANDHRFDNVNVRWNFWLVGTSLTDFVQGLASQPHLPPGVVSQPLDGRVTIWAKTWSQIIDDCEHRLKFVQDKLAYSSTHDAGVAYLRREHEKYIPEGIRKPQAQL